MVDDQRAGFQKLNFLDLGLVAARKGAQRQVLVHGQKREHLAPLGHMHDATLHHLMRLGSLYLRAVKSNRALFGVHDTRDGLQQGGLTGTVRAKFLRIATFYQACVTDLIVRDAFLLSKRYVRRVATDFRKVPM